MVLYKTHPTWANETHWTVQHLLPDVEPRLDLLAPLCIPWVTFSLAVQRVALVACRTACFNMQHHKCWTATPPFDATDIEVCINGFSNKLLVLIRLNVVACKSCKVCKCLSVSSLLSPHVSTITGANSSGSLSKSQLNRLVKCCRKRRALSASFLSTVVELSRLEKKTLNKTSHEQMDKSVSF